MTELVMYVIYGPNQREHPGRFVTRMWFTDANGRQEYSRASMLAESLSEARRCVPVGKVKLRRRKADDPAIVEVWL